jgi:hypothetical protein
LKGEQHETQLCKHGLTLHVPPAFDRNALQSAAIARRDGADFYGVPKLAQLQEDVVSRVPAIDWFYRPFNRRGGYG